ncbi:MAG: OmpA family protein [Lewinellaceae bacterium]|nr:OmpA family protein [Lewinellaceae bacterium]
MKRIGFFWLLVAAPVFLFSQATWEIGLSGGVTAYAGDLNEKQYFDYNTTKFAYGLLVRRHFGPVLAARFNYLGGKIAGDESIFSEPYWRSERAFKFSTDFHEAGLLLEWDIFGYRRRNGWRFRKIFAPYVFAGAGYTFFKPQTDYNDAFQENPSVSADRILADKNAPADPPTLVLNFGGGFKWDIGRYWLIGFELGLRPTFTDRLDGVSVSGIADKRDWYAFAGITLTHRIREVDSDRDWIPNRRDKCPLSPGPRKLKGCPDADGDGITDTEDDCPEVPGVLSARGCPDADGDTVQDSFDLCPEVVGSVAACGCPDADGDRVPDIEDKCPEEAGFHHLDGCPDRDGDGIADRLDHCPDAGGLITPDGCSDADADGIADSADGCPDQKGPIQHLGCPDTDADGIPDVADKCPTVQGLFVFEGCPDTDGDGMQDSEDKCPKVHGLAKFQGCPDTDGDGLEDSEDRCPRAPGTLANKGCPEIKKETKKLLNTEGKKIQFETGSDVLLAESIPVVQRVAEILQDFPNYRVIISGHTDSQGGAKKNQALSDRRAKRCVEKLVELGVDAERLSAKGYGKSKPVASNKTAKGRAQNRRVEFELVRMF